jgi:hypothetical protein
VHLFRWIGCFVAAALFGAVVSAAPSSDTNVWWSLRRLVRPAVQPTQPGENPIDTFLLARLKASGLSFSPEAPRQTLIRRVYFDLIGLPPAPEEVEEFVRDADPRAYEHLVDRLLDLPQYGERWARHWLDVVHYGDTHGYDKDKPRPNAWPYRDYVIRAFNQDRPYSRFVQEQIAGDVLFPDTRDGIEALGFISAGPWDFIGHAEVSETKIDGKIARHLDRDDMVANTMNTFNSFTVQCAQCHNHKFDPIPTEDYYKLQAVFAAVDRTEREYYDDPELTRKRTALNARRGMLEAERKSLEEKISADGGPGFAELKKKLETARKPSGEVKHSQENAALEIATLEEKVADLLKLKVPAETRAHWTETTNDLASIQGELSAMPRPMVTFIGGVHYGSGSFRGTGPEGGKPRKISVLPRGDVRHPGKEVAPGALSAVAELAATFDIPSDAGEGERRKALALWLSDARNPLTWRSIVNRVWQYHFGRGLAGTPNDFGRMGEQPSHPELLDWLAVEFRDGGQSLKKLHKLILTSAAYRQISSVTAETERAVEIDSENRLLWRANRRKLEAEAVRDAVLFVSGQLDSRMYGPGFQDFVVEKPEHSPHYEYEKFNPEDPSARRRSIYRFIVRSQQQPFMTTLDCADPSMLVARRNESVSPLQALALLNNGFMLTMADAFARRLESESPGTDDRVARAFSLALSRPASAGELAELREFARKNGLQNACRVLFNLNEFAFAD